MNLQNIAVGVISAVNPQQPLSIQVSTGYTQNADGKRVPTYTPPITGVSGQVQNLTFRDITQLDALNIQGSQRAIYINGHINGLVRVTNKGGDLVTLPNGQIWLVTHVLEHWPDWCKCAITLQTDPTVPIT